MPGKKVIITGAAGFIGANLVRRLLERGDEPHILLPPAYPDWRIRNLKSQVSIHPVDLLDREGLEKTVQAVAPELIFHLAVYGAYSFQEDIDRILQTNIIGTANLVQACLKTDFSALVNTGSSSEYGFKDHPPLEDEYIEPNSYYSVSKAAATHFCRFTAHKTGRKIPTLRLYNIYGPYEEPARLIPALLVKGFDKKLPPLVNPAISRDLVYIDDVTDAYLLAAESQLNDTGAIYNISTGIQSTLKDIVAQVRKIIAIPEEPQWGSMKDRRWDTEIWIGDSSKIRSELGWQPKISLEEGLKKTIEWLEGDDEMLEYYKKSVG